MTSPWRNIGTSRAIHSTAAAVGFALLGMELLRGGAPSTTFLLALSFMLQSLIPLRLPRGTVFTSMGGLATAAAVLAGPAGGAGALLTGDSLGAAIRGDTADIRTMTLRLLRSVLVAGATGLYLRFIPQIAVENLPSRVGLAAVGTGLAFMLADLVLHAVGDTGHVLAGPPGAFANLLVLLGRGYVAQVSVGAALALVYPRLEIVAFVVLVPLMMIMVNTDALLMRVKTAYLKTVAALARAAEMQDPSRRGHAERTARIAVLLAQRLGLDSRTLERLSLAALLHDIGRVSAESDVGPINSRRIAVEGSSLIARVSFLASLAPILAKQAVPYVNYLDERDMDGLLARVIRVASDYDSLLCVSATEEPRSVQSALATMSASAGIDYDPRIVAELARVAERGELPVA